ncbi:hypothetical protein DUI87_13845 [Hirundo rustica rustica]|uniref:Peptidase M12B propeptide domain-containing protein n=1 Tax=Hirundo rustica rustica TaxID=333673 RepID=A0A3M0K6Q7_HIRRU|nr:hypothetical protein DUI87_13845 [Hirundo rustica rustica]
MDCLLLAVWTLPAAILGGGSMRFQTLPWLGSAVKAGRERFSLAVAWCAFVPDYVFVTPVRVDASGSYISHDVLHSTRRKRSTQSSKSSLHYKFSAFGQELHLELKPSTILSSSFIVQVLGKDGVSNSQEHEIEQCFYQEFIRNDSTSSVCRLGSCVQNFLYKDHPFVHCFGEHYSITPYYTKHENNKKSPQENEMTMGNGHIHEDILGFTRKMHCSVSGLNIDLTVDELRD